MRNRVAIAGVRGLVRICVVLVLMPAALALAAQTANASTADGVSTASMPFPVGPVGIAVVVVGLGGLVTGLVRHRRRELAAGAVVEPKPEQPITERAA